MTLTPSRTATLVRVVVKVVGERPSNAATLVGAVCAEVNYSQADVLGVLRALEADGTLDCVRGKYYVAGGSS